jgi:cold shock CspA family protein
MSSINDVVTQATSAERLTGRVKWFNNKAGYGFVTVTDGSRSGSDIFVHHSSIGVENQQYKYLVQGEYVEFSLSTTQGGSHEFHAANVGGINNGKLMCETRREFKIARTSYKGPSATQEESFEPVKMPRQQRTPTQTAGSRGSPPQTDSSERVKEQKSQRTQTTTPRVRGEGPRDGTTKEWTVVGKQTNKDVAKPAGKPRGRPPRSAEQPV